MARLERRTERGRATDHAWVLVVTAFVSLSLMPVSMAVAGPVSEVIGVRNTFLITGIVPGVVAVVAIWWAKVPQDELAHPLD